MKANSEVLSSMINYLISQGLVKSEAELARKAAVNKSTLSQILNGKRRTSNATYQKINQAFGCIFNPDYWLGKSDIMLLVDAEKGGSTAAMPSLINAAIAAKDETIRALREQIADLQQYITDLRRTINMLQYDGYKAYNVAETIPQQEGVNKSTNPAEGNTANQDGKTQGESVKNPTSDQDVPPT